MRVHNPELMSALLDGELRGVRRWLVERHLRRCAICAAEYRRVHRVRDLLAANPATAPMSDSPEFFWSKVKREIEARAGQMSEAPAPKPSVIDWLSQHGYALAAAAATLVAAVGVIWMAHTPPPGKPAMAPVVVMRGNVATVEHVATVLEHAVATPVQQDDAGVAVIWVSGLPWMPDMTTMKTRFANLDS